MDVAWKVGSAGPADDWELRMSMRSFWMHYSGVAKYWIIGHIPEWIDQQKVCCLPWPDPYQKCKDANLLHKALRLAMEPQISDPFIFCSDDQLVLRPSTPVDFKLWHDGDIPEELGKTHTKWHRRLHHTGARLRSAGFPAKNFDGHIPYPFYKHWVREALRFDFAAKPGMCVQSTILNCSGEPGISIRSSSVRAWLGQADVTEQVIDARLAKFRFACLTDRSVENKHLVARLEQLFSDPAPWELDASTWPRLVRPSS